MLGDHYIKFQMKMKTHNKMLSTAYSSLTLLSQVLKVKEKYVKLIWVNFLDHIITICNRAVVVHQLIYLIACQLQLLVLSYDPFSS